METSSDIASIHVLGTRLDMVAMPEVMAIMTHWIEAEPSRVHHVVNTGMHGIMEAHKDPSIASALNAADLLAPDGILAITLARFHGYRLRKQDTGPELLWRFSEVANERGFKYFFFGDTTETLDLLSSNLLAEYPALKIVGKESPPFRQFTLEEDQAMVSIINEARPDVLWVGLGMPKQEKWIFEHRNTLKVPVVVGAGASFKFISGTVPRAPSPIANLGFEWLWRLIQEPGRIWRRVVFDAPTFIVLALLEVTGLKKY